MTKRTDANLAKILELHGTGLSLVKCCQAVGMSDETLRLWRKDDPTIDERLGEQWAGFVQGQHDVVVSSSKGGDVNSAKWLLERLAPEDYGLREKVDVSVVLEMPGLLTAGSSRASAWLQGATDADWKALDERAKTKTLTAGDLELLGVDEAEEAD